MVEKTWKDDMQKPCSIHWVLNSGSHLRVEAVKVEEGGWIGSNKEKEGAGQQRISKPLPYLPCFVYLQESRVDRFGTRFDKGRLVGRDLILTENFPPCGAGTFGAATRSSGFGCAWGEKNAAWGKRVACGMSAAWERSVEDEMNWCSKEEWERRRRK